MKIDDRIKKCVAFLQYQLADGTYNYVGTCFFVITQLNNSQHYSYAVTAKHVIIGVKNFGLNKILIRLNLKNGKSIIYSTQIDNWIVHPDDSVDIAMLRFNFDEGCDHLYYSESLFMTESLIKDNEIDCGDEVFITGLFKHYTGSIKNSPIVRIGNIALMPTEKIQVGGKFRDTYLIESRSIGGLSGSPVFVNLGHTRRLGGEVKQALGEHIPPLFGLVYGHFDSNKSGIDTILDTTSDQEKINVGIAIITPVSKLSEMLNFIKTKNP